MQKKLTNEEKIKIYEQAIMTIRFLHYRGLCTAIYGAEIGDFWHNHKYFPEVFTLNLWWRSARGSISWHHHWWWPQNEKGRKTRIAILKKAIAKCKEKIELEL